MTKASDNEYPSVLFGELGSAPTTPASGKWRLFTKSTGMFLVDDAGAVTGPFIDTAGSGVSADLLPRQARILPYNLAAATVNTNWTGSSADSTSIYGSLSQSSGAQNAEVGWDVVLSAGVWRADMIHAKTTTYGIYTLLFDAVSKGTIDGYNGSLIRNQASAITGIVVATTALIRVSLKMATKNASASSYFGSFQELLLTRTA